MDLAYNKEWKIFALGALCHSILCLNCYADSSIRMADTVFLISLLSLYFALECWY